MKNVIEVWEVGYNEANLVDYTKADKIKVGDRIWSRTDQGMFKVSSICECEFDGADLRVEFETFGVSFYRNTDLVKIGF